MTESKSNLESFLDLIPEPAAIIDFKGNILAINSKIEKMIRFNRNELIGKNVFYVAKQLNISVSARTKGHLMKNITKRIMGSYIKPYKVKVVGNDGRRIWAEISAERIEFYGKPAVLTLLRDVTEQSNSQKMLQKSELKFKSLVNGSMSAIVTTDNKGNFTYINKTATELFGYSSVEMLGRSFKDFLHPEDRGKIIHLFLNILILRRQPRPLEFRVIQKGGKILYLMARPTKFVVNGKTMGFQVIIVDLTERKKAEDTLKASEEKFKCILASSPDAITVADLKGNIIECNKATLKLFGLSSKNELIGKDGFKLISKKDRERARNEFKTILKSGSIKEKEYLFLTKDGREFPVELSISHLKNSKGAPVGFVSIAKDITNRKQAEEAIKRSEMKYKSIYESSINALYSSSLDGHILDMNPSGILMLGYKSLEELKKKKIEDIYLDLDDRRKFIELAKEGPVKGFKTKLKKKDGKLIDVLLDGNAVKDELGKTIGFQGDIIDITEHKRIEKEFNKIKEERMHAEIKDKFLSTATHELKTPLVSIKGYLDYALSRSINRMPKDISSNLQVVKRNTDRLVALTEDLLDIRRIDSGNLQLNLKSLDLTEIINEVFNEIKSIIKEKKQTININNTNESMQISGDKLRLEQIFINLLSNASKFSPEWSNINIEVKKFKKEYQIQVSDQGIGIKDKDLKRIFEPFANIEKPTHVKGTNLGLSVTKGLVEAHGGRIWADSPGLGKGATFTVILPNK
jgi:PAS domain S-box-containing protein